MDENLSSHDAASLASTLNVILTEMREGFAALNTRVDALEKRVDEVEAQLKQLRNDTAEMWREIGQRIDDRSDELRRDLSRFKSDFRSDLSQASQLSRSQIDFETQNLHGRIGALEERMTIVERRVASQTSE
jgi:chromosome segregation ATPase